MAEFNENDHQLFRSHFLNTDQLAADTRAGSDDRSPDAPVGPLEKEVENGWLNIRIGRGEWASAKEFSQVRFDPSQQGRIADAPPSTDASDQPSYADPVADGIDPTAPESPESRF